MFFAVFLVSIFVVAPIYIGSLCFSVEVEATDTDASFYADFLPRVCIILVVLWCGTSAALGTCGRFSRLVDACRSGLFQSVVVASVFRLFHSECKYIIIIPYESCRNIARYCNDYRDICFAVAVRSFIAPRNKYEFVTSILIGVK